MKKAAPEKAPEQLLDVILRVTFRPRGRIRALRRKGLNHAQELRQEDLDFEKQGFDLQERQDDLLSETLRAYRAGILLAAGPDTGVDLMPHGRLYKDIEWYVKAGIPIEEVVKIATLNGARAAAIDNKTGSLEVGKAADIVVLRGDLSRDPTVLKQVAIVIRAGRILFDRNEKWTPCQVK